MEMNMLPRSILLFPHSGLFYRFCMWRTIFPNSLNQSDVAYNGDIVSNYSHMRRSYCGVYQGRFLSGLSLLLSQLEIKVMEFHSLHQMSRGLRLKARQSWITKSIIVIPITILNVLKSLGKLQ